MEEKLEVLFKECINELKSIGIDIENKKEYGIIDIKIARRNTKRYGCCKQENPDKSTRYRLNRKIHYAKFNNHHIEISKWLLELNDDIIKNTIIHELIHCLPYCNNHGKEFKYYANLINDRLGYNITRLGNKEEDYIKSGLEYKKETKIVTYKYKIVCNNCGQTFYRQRLSKNFMKRYVCGKCKGKFQIFEI